MNIRSIFISCTLLAAMSAAGCTQEEDAGTCGISISPLELTLKKGQTASVTATTEPAGQEVRWESSDTSVATVAADGTVTAVETGSADIIAAAGNASATCMVTVTAGTEPEQIIVPEEHSMTRGESITLDIRVLPLDADMSLLEYASSDESKATVSGDGTITGIAAGETMITISAGNVSATCRLTVLPVTAESITLEKTSLDMEKGESYQLTASISPADVDDRTLTWTSSDEYVASVDKDGLVKALSVGTATITAECAGASATCQVTVTGKPNVGDWYFSDGTWGHKANPNKEIIGIVFWAGDPGKDDSYLRSEHPECTNGLAVSLEDMNDYAMWQEAYAWKKHKAVISEWIEANTEFPGIQVQQSYDERIEQILGYGFTKALASYDACEDHAEYRIEMIKGLNEFIEQNPAPEQSSGWFIPSVEELDLLCNGVPDGRPGWEPLTNKKLLNGRLAEIGARTFDSYLYWSCMELDEDNGYVFAFDQGVPMYDLKPSGRQLCFIIAF